MPELPPGWRLSNSAGSWSGQLREEEQRDSTDSDESDERDDIGGLDVRPDSPGWEDLEDDVESVNVKCLLCDLNFTFANLMLGHCKNAHEFDFLAIRQQHELDFYSTMKLINYVRTAVMRGVVSPDVSDTKLWTGDEYLQPALGDDALLFSLDELVDFGQGQDGEAADYDHRQATTGEHQHAELDTIGED